MAFNFLYSPVFKYLDNQKSAVLSERVNDPHRRALGLWTELQTQLGDPEARQSFEASLSPQQLKVWNILDDWWNGRYQRDSPNADPVATLDFIKVAERTWEDDPTNSTNVGYGSSLAHLFAVEMVWHASIGQLEHMPAEQMSGRVKSIVQEFRDKCYVARKRALKYAIMQMVGWLSFRTLTGGALQRSEAVRGTTLQPCPWLKDESESVLRKPLYLWDRVSQKTLHYSSLQDKEVRYYCISHTWGRWRKGSICVPGVPWPVPTNTCFDVLQLREAFSKLNWPVRYLWFDLFCIPQEECPERAEEIGKQADIFRRAQKSVIWMHDVLGWELLENAIMWLGLRYLYFTLPNDEEIRSCADDFTRRLNSEFADSTSAETLLDPWLQAPENDSEHSDQQDKRQEDPGSKWFSSLWTLQEAYLCPSATLADRSWNLLTIRNQMVITLDTLASLAYSNLTDNESSTNRPSIAEVLIFTIKRWELSDLASSSRMSLMIAAESRQSTGPRAEAIMSAMGVTGWFEKYRLQFNRAPPEDNLVFGLYPLDFLVEAQHNIGGAFFLPFRMPQNTYEDAASGKPLGTMLPLAHNRTKWQVAQAMNFATDNWSNSTSDTWEIQLNGSVVIRNAVILARNETDGAAGADGPVYISSPTGSRVFESFHIWKSEQPSAPYRFAVAVIRYGYRQLGVTLEGVRSQSNDSQLILVKTGIFRTEGRWCKEGLFGPSSVNWVVV